MKKEKSPNITLKDIEELLNRQTVVILSAVDEKLSKTELRINQVSLLPLINSLKDLLILKLNLK